jgi:hypothetical protein
VSDRLAAGVGVVGVLAALAIIWIARAGVPRDIYVSELGADGQPTASWFEAALLLLVAGGASIAWAGRRIRSRVPVLRAWAPWMTLGIACGLFLLASQITCTAGCPVPYGPAFTWQDFIHTTAAALAFAAACWAMLQCAAAAGRRTLARVSLVAAIGVGVIAGAGGLMSLLEWNANIGSHLEFVATTIGIGWVAVLGMSLALPQRRLDSRFSGALPRFSGTAGSNPWNDGVPVLVGAESSGETRSEPSLRETRL